MDSLAKTYWSVLDKSRPPNVSIPGPPGHWTIWQHGTRLPTWSLSVAQRTFYRSRAQKYWDAKLANPHALQAFDWTAAAKALRRLPTHIRLWVPKWICSMIPYGGNLVRWGHQESIACPRCGLDERHRHHILSCPHAGAAALIETRLDQLRASLDTSLTDPDLKLGLMDLIRASFSDTDWTPPPTTSPRLSLVFNTQLTLGTRHVKDGLLSHLWASAQHEYFLSIGKRTTGTIWASKVIHRIWQIAWDLWIHRRRIKGSLDDQSLAARHAILDTAIADAFHRYNLHPNPTFARWFARSPQLLHYETIDWKERWLEMVDTLAS